ncbi:hypothetical protein GGR57DRAFT_442641 [Xylariaceae sp. FL1272]|nr:hypothetical protein GGR57DRAFT_442641 [Xylariaceae sp. FL1272]
MARLPSTTTAPPSSAAPDKPASHARPRHQQHHRHHPHSNPHSKLLRAPAADRPRHAGAAAAFPPLSQSNSPAVSLEPSTARGQSIPLPQDTAAHRTTALRELSRSQPIGRPRYPNAAATATATTAGTYSQPVLVRTYAASATSSAYPSGRRSTRPPAPSASHSTYPSYASRTGRSRRSFAMTLVRPRILQRPEPPDGRLEADVKLPPLEAFTFKGIMADIEHDIETDLDRIAEICARSRYSLSNQYEIHVAPHGSGAAFVQPVHRDIPSAPTLQAISSDDERHGLPVRQRTGVVRRRSAAYGTLETIMSSSRSDDDERAKRKSAAQIAAHVRHAHQAATTGETACGSGSRSGSGSANSTEAQASSELHTTSPRSTLAAAILKRSSAQSMSSLDGHATGLVGRPARAEMSNSHLMSTTTTESRTLESRPPRLPATQELPSSVFLSKSVAAASIAAPEEHRAPSSLLKSVRLNIPWKGAGLTSQVACEYNLDKSESYAINTLKNILKDK